MQVQTVFKAGNSEVIAIPSELREQTGIKAGTKVVLTGIPGGGGIVIKKVDRKQKTKSALTAEFKKWLKEVLEEDKEILDELALR
ncbi:MAG: hypothetical protein UX25_C0035G0009 [Candidatus Woesebacteria bacterium GW2011_GWC2_45_9]|uniref:SpoVT-AbrB domain-containing protein n=1 Tax=Candidatus Woesebacteria bacterium GW2011_GWC2_45_9 TaxID=1618589 RepID=A0A0G1N7N2_9BACT|nr:MAG: hypothetical protein UX25_C0035G0009 [Candidatus Woesebacteria bacterium GW2011_GWC2_45_9]